MNRPVTEGGGGAVKSVDHIGLKNLQFHFFNLLSNALVHVKLQLEYASNMWVLYDLTLRNAQHLLCCTPHMLHHS